MNNASGVTALSVMPVWDGVLRIVPAGVFRPTDGRSISSGAWQIDAASARQVIANTNAGGKDVVIDYEHQTLLSEKNGQPAPAAGWFSTLEWREGEGLVATDVRWTARAKAAINAGEYRYISPVFSFDPVTGHVTKINSVALTNSPALADLNDLGAVAVNSTNRSGSNGSGESARSIAAFNAIFGPSGVFHPETPQSELAALKQVQSPAKPTISPGISETERIYLRRCFPGVFED